MPGQQASRRRRREFERVARSGRRRKVATKYASISFTILVVATFVTSATLSLYWRFHDWSGDQTDAFADRLSIGLIAAEDVDLSNSFLVGNSPSLDLAPTFNADGSPQITGIFRVNAIATPEEGQLKVGITLPMSSVVLALGAGGETRVASTTDDPEGPTDYEGHGFSCLPPLGSGATDIEGFLAAHNRISEADGEPSISDYAGNAYELECRDNRLIAWVVLPNGRDGSEAVFEPGAQTLSSPTAAHVAFTIPAEASGVVQAERSAWHSSFYLETNPLVDGAKGLGEALGSEQASSSVLSFGASYVETTPISPPGNTMDIRGYTLSVNQSSDGCAVCRSVRLFDQGPAATWSGLLDGDVHGISVEFVDESSRLIENLVQWLAIFMLGLMVPSPWSVVKKVSFRT